EACAACFQQPQMAVHRVLVQGNQQIHVVAHVRHRIGAGAHGQKCMTSANNGLVSVVRVHMKATAAEYLAKNVPRRCHSLTGCASDANAERLPHRCLPSPSRGSVFGVSGTSACSGGQGFYVVLQRTGKQYVTAASTLIKTRCPSAQKSLIDPKSCGLPTHESAGRPTISRHLRVGRSSRSDSYSGGRPLHLPRK